MVRTPLPLCTKRRLLGPQYSALGIVALLLMAAAIWPCAASADGYWQTPRTVATGDSLNAVDMIDANRGWASGANGAILVTRDGGDTWEPQMGF